MLFIVRVGLMVSEGLWCTLGWWEAIGWPGSVVGCCSLSLELLFGIIIDSCYVAQTNLELTLRYGLALNLRSS